MRVPLVDEAAASGDAAPIADSRQMRVPADQFMQKSPVQQQPVGMIPQQPYFDRVRGGRSMVRPTPVTQIEPNANLGPAPGSGREASSGRGAGNSAYGIDQQEPEYDWTRLQSAY
jgi:hypothetical protein